MRTGLLLVAASVLLLVGLSARAEVPATLKIGVINDMNGPFADQSGKGSVVAAQMAAEDFAAERQAPFEVEILAADHQNKADIGSQIVREWVDREGVAAVADSVNSAVGLAINQVMRERHRTFIATNVGTSDLTGKACAPTTVQWTMDTWALGNAAARALMEKGGNTWFFIAFDYALGAALERDATQVLTSLGGKVLWSVRHPLGTTDFSSYLIQAQSSGAKVVALADTGSDLVNGVKQASEFGLTKHQMLAGMFTQIVDVDSIGLKDAQGLLVTEAFYLDLNDKTRAFSHR
ncbi:MAG: ABC transporter substrate-binding protein, partial [Rhodospirillales bacterium]|nr:ABC transporter substrate-binding protein [Rhodospirillales bacterium]